MRFAYFNLSSLKPGCVVASTFIGMAVQVHDLWPWMKRR